jgi:hypothetical protein
MPRTDLLRALTHADQVRLASKAAFGREFLIESCLAIAALDDTFLFEDVFVLLAEVADQAGVQPPSSSAIRKDLERLRDTFGVIERLPATRGERLRREVRRPSQLWSLCIELVDRVSQR